MGNHTHHWTPVDGHTANYSCECGSTGYRATIGGIREHKQPKKFSTAWSVRNRRDQGRVEPLIREDFDGPKERES